MSVRSPGTMKIHHEATRRTTKMLYESFLSSCVLVYLRGSIIFIGGTMSFVESYLGRLRQKVGHAFEAVEKTGLIDQRTNLLRGRKRAKSVDLCITRHD